MATAGSYAAAGTGAAREIYPCHIRRNRLITNSGACEGERGWAASWLRSCVAALAQWLAGCTIVSCAIVNYAGGSSDNVTHTVIGTVRIVLAAAAIVTAALAAMAQGTPSAEETRKRLEAEKARQDASEKREKALKADLEKLEAEHERINALLVATGKRIQQSEAELSKIEGKLAELEVDESKLRGTLEQRHGAISALLAALQRMGRNPPPVMITRREDALTMVRSAMLLSSAFPELRWQAVGLAKELKSLAAVIKTGRAEREKLAAEKTRHDEARIKLAALQDDKRRTSAQQQAELDSVRQEVARIARSVEEMSDLLQRLDKGAGP